MEAEQSVLGGLLLDNSRWDDVSDKVAGPDFYLRYHRIILVHPENRYLNGFSDIISLKIAS